MKKMTIISGQLIDNEIVVKTEGMKVEVNGKEVELSDAHEEMKKLYAGLDKDKKEKAINFLKEKFDKKCKKDIRKAIKKDKRWYAPYHFTWGMNVRNALRKNGYGEEYFGITNLDDIYVQLIEDAVKQ